ncbi:hypothetical protein L484_015992 [Morus notabilis]|uniref:Uncharacterized protein n=1 Tax=Morus notabilis TaxID=981085 RepID=W9RRB1_9ROSA|nr:hypothetical protein L484_015992 [Morus notabilis]
MQEDSEEEERCKHAKNGASEEEDLGELLRLWEKSGKLRRWADSKAQGEEPPADTTSRLEEGISKEDEEAAELLEAEEGHSHEVRVHKVPNKFNDFVRA